MFRSLGTSEFKLFREMLLKMLQDLWTSKKSESAGILETFRKPEKNTEKSSAELLLETFLKNSETFENVLKTCEEVLEKFEKVLEIVEKVLRTFEKVLGTLQKSKRLRKD